MPNMILLSLKEFGYSSVHTRVGRVYLYKNLYKSGEISEAQDMTRNRT